MKILLIHLLMLSPVPLEAAFDKIMWVWKGPGKDKPFSTWILRPILMGGALWGVMLLDEYTAWWAIAFVIVSYFGAFFPPLINVVLGENICHMSKTSPYDRLVGRIPCIFRIWMFIWIAIVAVCTYYYYG